MNYVSLINAINTQLSGISGVPVLAKENSAYKPNLLKPWMRSTLLPAEPTQVSIGVNRIMRYNGLMQVDVFVPANTGTTDTTVDKIVDHFNNTRFVTDSGQNIVIEKVWRGVGLSETDWYKVSVYVRWTVFSE